MVDGCWAGPDHAAGRLAQPPRHAAPRNFEVDSRFDGGDGWRAMVRRRGAEVTDLLQVLHLAAVIGEMGCTSSVLSTSGQVHITDTTIAGSPIPPTVIASVLVRWPSNIVRKTVNGLAVFHMPLACRSWIDVKRSLILHPTLIPIAAGRTSWFPAIDISL